MFEFCYKKYGIGECVRQSLKKEQMAHSNWENSRRFNLQRDIYSGVARVKDNHK